MPVDARAALERLRQAIDAGELDDRLEALGVDVMGAFGSSTRPDGEPSDLDIGARFAGRPDLLGLIDLLVATTGFDKVDVAAIEGEHPALDAEALCGVPLYESVRGAFAEAQMAALGHRRDTARFRAMDRERMAR
jgi:predicted nucleotidyltransferase